MEKHTVTIKETEKRQKAIAYATRYEEQWLSHLSDFNRLQWNLKEKDKEKFEKARLLFKELIASAAESVEVKHFDGYYGGDEDE